MKCKRFVPMVISAAALVTANGLMAADEMQDPNTEAMVELNLREEIASPLIGEFAQFNDVSRTGWQQDFGGTSGTANGMDGFPTATDEPSAYPAPGSDTDGLSNSPGGGSYSPY